MPDKSTFSEYPIHVDQLCVGLYVRIDDKRKIPFAKRGFKIKTEKEIEKIRKSGLTHVTCILSKSDRMPLSTAPEEIAGRKPKPAPEHKAAPKTPLSKELSQLKQETLERNKERKKKFTRCEKRYDTTVSQVVTLLRRVSGRSGEAVREAAKVMDTLVETFLSDRDVTVNLMNTKPTEARSHYHALNVTVLSMLLGKELGLDADTMHGLGMGALFHDIGKGRVPIAELKGGSATSLQYAVDKLYKDHPRLGAKLATDLPGFPSPSAHIILQHHELIDGSGFPNKLKNASISPLAKIVAIVNIYDNYVNKSDPKESLTPHEALKRMYSKQRNVLDTRYLTLFIKNMGVYPPGTVVQLSNGFIGTVLSINPSQTVRPSVLVFHPEIPKREALVIDLTLEPDIEISKGLRPESLTRDVFSYLRPSSQINYYADTLESSS
ncbi:MAG: HD-GYP domain-containing protein [Desulfovibrio sp.]|nr:MAG: HD-GYP domain-containing protein [Desulfovibrio sp.]